MTQALEKLANILHRKSEVEYKKYEKAHKDLMDRHNCDEYILLHKIYYDLAGDIRKSLK